MKKSDQKGARSRARELIVQSLYQMQIAGHDEAELKAQFHERPDYKRVDQKYYDDLLGAILGTQAELELSIDFDRRSCVPRPEEQEFATAYDLLS